MTSVMLTSASGGQKAEFSFTQGKGTANDIDTSYSFFLLRWKIGDCSIRNDNVPSVLLCKEFKNAYLVLPYAIQIEAFDISLYCVLLFR